MCKGFVNAYRLSLEDHTFFRCNNRHPWVKQTISGLYNLAVEQGLNLSMIIKLELESQLEEWKARDVLRGKVKVQIFWDGRQILKKSSTFPCFVKLSIVIIIHLIFLFVKSCFLFEIPIWTVESFGWFAVAKPFSVAGYLVCCCQPNYIRGHFHCCYRPGVRSCVSSPFSRCTPVLNWSE